MDSEQRKGEERRAKHSRLKSERKKAKKDMKQFMRAGNAEEILAQKYAKDAKGRYSVIVKTDKAMSAYNDNALDAAFVAHVESEYEFIPIQSETVLKLEGDNSARAAELLYLHFLQSAVMTARKLRNSSLYSAVSFVIGLLWLLLYGLLSYFNEKVLGEIIIIAAWVFIWAAVEMMFFGRNELRLVLFRKQRIMSALKKN